jgi:hypothetical protein
MSQTLVALFVGVVLASPLGGWAQSENQKVEMTLDYEERFKPGVSLIWSPCGQAAWDMMKLFHKVDAILVEPASRSADVMNALALVPAVLPMPTTLLCWLTTSKEPPW